MTPAEFTAAVESELRLQGAAFDRAELESFLASAWPLVEDEPEVIRWAYEFIESGRATLPA